MTQHTLQRSGSLAQIKLKYFISVVLLESCRV